MGECPKGLSRLLDAPYQVVCWSAVWLNTRPNLAVKPGPSIGCPPADGGWILGIIEVPIGISLVPVTPEIAVAAYDIANDRGHNVSWDAEWGQ
jgi:hypothetical protein